MRKLRPIIGRFSENVKNRPFSGKNALYRDNLFLRAILDKNSDTENP